MVDNNNKRICPYGDQCYRNNALHFQEFDHQKSTKRQSVNNGDNGTIIKRNKRTTIDDVIGECNGFFLNYLPNRLNRLSNRVKTITLKAILSKENGKIVRTIHFSYLYNLEWYDSHLQPFTWTNFFNSLTNRLIDQYPADCQNTPIDIVFGDRNNDGDVDQLKIDSLLYSNVSLCPIQMKGKFSCHHSKMMILLYDDGIRIVILSSNFIPMDFYAVTQGIWVSPKLKMKSDDEEKTCKTNFKKDLIEYLTHYRNKAIEKWINIIKDYDFSPINVFLIGSIPNSHANTDRDSFGHMKLRKILKTSEYGPTNEINNWPIICQFSSIGSLGPTPESWLTGQFSASLSALYNDYNGCKATMKCIYPTVANILNSIEPTGSSFPYSKITADKQPYLNEFFHQWKASAVSNRNDVMPHIKTYARLSPDNKEMAWFCLTSANLSKAAWGQLVKSGSKFQIWNYELGVLFLPKLMVCRNFLLMINRNSFSIDSQNNHSFPLPYDLPLVKYDQSDKPWVNS
ncbi:tyrosyl-DNA phosphodiesterase-like protein [Euroglyphus maynei]|uniref:Tyrosyl-DNA phosphodiesterase-like protein n=1 Tax=Euroglyphus maynei TaxID=6958 RepID=A0A1Y3AXX7_EURMA|nr:tyrosyl-DNA phosphodiesterase-like protein [Euroglyphus maynei]